MQIYDSPDDANARLDEYAGEGVSGNHVISWEDRLKKEVQKVGRLLIKNSVHRDGDQILGFCSVSYTDDARFITIFHGYECDTPREFVRDLVAITD
jgi:hypothetical protein